MDSFDLMSSDHFYVILHSDKKHGLIFNRLDDSIATINHDDARELSNLKRVGITYGIIGKYLDKYLVLVKDYSKVGSLYEPITKTEHDVYVINQVEVVDVSCLSKPESMRTNTTTYDDTTSANKVETETTSKDSTVDQDPADFSSLPVTISSSSYASMQSRSTPWNPFKLANSLKPKMPTQFLKSTAIDALLIDGSGSVNHNTSQAEDSDKRLVLEMMKLFNNTNSFYFSPTLDLTNRFSRNITVKISSNDAMWKTADEKFFWNKYMLKDLIELSEKDPDANLFMHVILQGFVAIDRQTVFMNYTSDLQVESELSLSMNSITANDGNIFCDRQPFSNDASESHTKRRFSKSYHLAIVSRRSVFQAGTRYRRRGCDERGNCANFVETEQIFRYKHHFTSLVILRGSIPLFWYQTGYNYRPPLVLYKSEEENHLAISNHFVGLIETYNSEQIIAVDCTEHSGREKNIHDTFKQHFDLLRDSHPKLKLMEFDFHKHCSGRQCSDEFVFKQLKTCGLTEKLLNDIKYYWNDGDLVWNQDGVFRVNCLDCTDRTNVVQRAIALKILDIQLARLGIIAPDANPENNICRKVMQQMWSANGNVLSTQYCGTKALFNEEKKIAGYLKDTYSSASRYYFSKFRDVYRQAAIDAMLGIEGNLKTTLPTDKVGGLDHYELINLDPLLKESSGTALLKDVGNRVSNRLARLTGRLYIRPTGAENIGMTQNVVDMIDENDSEFMEARIEDTLDGLNIDWPSSESVEIAEKPSNSNTFAQMSSNDNDNFQDDEFSQLMLSVDLKDLQRPQDEVSGSNGNQENTETKCEEIDMKETCSIKPSNSDTTKPSTSTTST